MGIYNKLTQGFGSRKGALDEISDLAARRTLRDGEAVTTPQPPSKRAIAKTKASATKMGKTAAKGGASTRADSKSAGRGHAAADEKSRGEPAAIEKPVEPEMSDIGILIIYPDYDVTVGGEVYEWIAKKDEKWELGHAGVVFIDSKDKIAIYYEFGRYVTPVRSKKYSVAYGANGLPTRASIKNLFKTLSIGSGQNGEVFGLWREIDSYAKAIEWPEAQKTIRNSGHGSEYSWHSNNCGTFARTAMVEAGEFLIPPMLPFTSPEAYKALIIGSASPFVQYEPNGKDITTFRVDLK